MSYVKLKGRLDPDFKYNVSECLSNAQIDELLFWAYEAPNISITNTRSTGLMSRAVIEHGRNKAPVIYLICPTDLSTVSDINCKHYTFNDMLAAIKATMPRST